MHAPAPLKTYHERNSPLGASPPAHIDVSLLGANPQVRARIAVRVSVRVRVRVRVRVSLLGANPQASPEPEPAP